MPEDLWTAVFVGDPDEPVATFRYQDQARAWADAMYPAGRSQLRPWVAPNDMASVDRSNLTRAVLAKLADQVRAALDDHDACVERHGI